jgi:hypothetical protein
MWGTGRFVGTGGVARTVYRKKPLFWHAEFRCVVLRFAGESKLDKGSEPGKIS